MADSLRLKLLIGFGVGVGVTVGVAWYRKLRQIFPRPPSKDKWRYVGKLEEIIFFPVKSCTGIVLDEGRCGFYGLEDGHFRDRMFMLIDKTGKVGFAGAYPKMYKIKTQMVAGGILKVTAPGMDDLEIVLKDVSGGKTVYKKSEGGNRPLIKCGSVYDAWFSKFLLNKEEGMMLFYCSVPIPKSPKRFFGIKEETPNFFMVTTESSVADVNSRLENKTVHHRQFRGNFLIKTEDSAPFQEDDWTWLKIGDDVVMRYKDACYRCILPNINVDTAERDRNFEPLRTLKKYRVKPGSKEPVLGAFFELYSPGIVKNGDPVYTA